MAQRKYTNCCFKMQKLYSSALCMFGYEILPWSIENVHRLLLLIKFCLIAVHGALLIVFALKYCKVLQLFREFALYVCLLIITSLPMCIISCRTWRPQREGTVWQGLTSICGSLMSSPSPASSAAVSRSVQLQSKQSEWMAAILPALKHPAVMDCQRCLGPWDGKLCCCTA